MSRAALLLWLALPAAAHAQAVDLRVPAPEAVELRDLRLSMQDERSAGGVALLIGGLASVVGGALAAGLGHEDPYWRAFGIGTAGWGAINAGLSLGLLDVGGGARAAIERDAALREDALAARQLEVLRSQHRSATLFALNVGLDVLYVVSGALLYVLADQLDAPDDAQAMRGYAAAQIGQGGFLFVFDLVEWIAAAGRADRVADLLGRSSVR